MRRRRMTMILAGTCLLINVNLQKGGITKGRNAKAYSKYLLGLQRSI
jgi:hypothetical protein